MDPITASIIASLGGGLLEGIFGSNAESMTPEQRRVLKFVESELRKSDTALGYSPKEKMDLQGQLKTGIREYGEKQTKQGTASIARRGAGSASNIAALTTGVKASGGEAYGKGLTDINLASISAGRQRRSQLTGMLPGLSQGRLDPGSGNLGIADFATNLARYYAMRDKKKKPTGDSAEGLESDKYYSNLQAPSFNTVSYTHLTLPTILLV